MAHQVIYVPGLGDRIPHGQSIILKLWRLFGLNVHYFPMGWADKEPFQPKLARLLAKIDELSKSKDPVSLVGVSAGGSAVIDAYEQRKFLNSVVLIAGKIHNPQAINQRYYDKNPAFQGSIAAVTNAVKLLTGDERRRILSIHPIWDNTVPVKDTKITGAQSKTVPALGHIPGIYYTIIFAIPAIAKFLKKQQQNH